ncbi:MAG: hypothetical protein ACXVA4_00645 [Ktedonobacterales bacterium]
MAVRLNRRAFDHAVTLIEQGQFVADERDMWSEHQPSTEEENRFIELYGIGEYAKWHLGVDDAEDADSKKHYKFPYGDFKVVHRCGILSAEVRAAQYKYRDIEDAAAHLHGMIDGAVVAKLGREPSDT